MKDWTLTYTAGYYRICKHGNYYRDPDDKKALDVNNSCCTEPVIQVTDEDIAEARNNLQAILKELS